MGYPLAAGRLVVPPWARTAAGAAGLAAVIGGAALIALDAATGTSGAVDDGRHVPRAILGPLAGNGGTHLYPARFWALLAIMTAGYAVLVFAGSLRAGAAITGIVALHVIALIGPPIASDVFSYLDYAHLGAVHGVNPYAHSPAFLPHDPAFRYVGVLWRHVASAYGPLFTLASYPAAALGLVGGVLYLKGLAVVSSLAVVGLVALCARRRGYDPVRAALVVGANPLLIVFAVEAAHNDLPMMALAMLGVWFTLSGRQARGAAAVVAGAAVKLSVLLVLPFMIAGAPGRLRTIRGAALAAIAVAALSFAVFGSHAFGFVPPLEHQQKLVTPHSFVSEMAGLLGSGKISPADRTVMHVLLVAAIVYLVARVWRGADWVSGAGWALLATAVLTTWLLAWYTLWALPFAAVGRDRRLLAAVLFIQGLYIAHRTIPLLVGTT
jgi:hypothetical protein